MPDTAPLNSEQIAKYEQDVSGDCPYFLQDIRPLLATIRSLTSALAKSEQAVEEELTNRDEAIEAFDDLVAVFGVETEYSNLRGYAEIHADCEAAWEALTSALEAERKRREGAPHSPGCDSLQRFIHVEPCPFWTQQYCLSEFPGDEVGCHAAPCNCWKAEETTK